MRSRFNAVEVLWVLPAARLEVHMIAVRPVTRTVQSFALFALPHGGQRAARRNAWASMSAEAAWARSRREAEQAMRRAISAQDRATTREHATR